MNDRFDERLLRYVEGRTPAAESAEIERELAASPRLAAEVEEARRGLAAVRDLAAAPTGPVPPLAEGTLDRLGASRAARPARAAWKRAAVIAALLLLPASGWYARGWLAPPTPAGRPPIPGVATSPTVPNPRMEPYLLLFTGEWPDIERLDPQERLERREAYMSWVEWLDENGRLVAGSELGGDPGIFLTSGGMGISEFEPDVPPGEIIVGFVYFRAESPEEAREIASRCPHVRYGSGVLLKHGLGMGM